MITETQIWTFWTIIGRRRWCGQEEKKEAKEEENEEEKKEAQQEEKRKTRRKKRTKRRRNTGRAAKRTFLTRAQLRYTKKKDDADEEKEKDEEEKKFEDEDEDNIPDSGDDAGAAEIQRELHLIVACKVVIKAKQKLNGNVLNTKYLINT